MKTVLTVLALIVSLCSIAQADTTCELMIYKKSGVSPERIPLVVQYQVEKEAYLNAKYEDVSANVILTDKTDQVSLTISDVAISTPLKFEKVHDVEIASVSGFKSFDINTRNFEKQILLSCIKK